MCGIAAIFSSAEGILSSAEGIQPRLIQEMMAVVRHRGPDGEGYLGIHDTGAIPFGGPDTPRDIFNSDFVYAPRATLAEGPPLRAALGHRRLSIVDLSPAGHQPMCTEDQRYWIVYNGEIYNHIELRAELEKAGYEFCSHTDTEVILHGYREWGPNCLHRFNGMFAFLIYDSVAGRIFVARDRFGVKPLYHWKSPAGFVAFASEIKQFTVLPGWHADLNRQTAYDFLNWGLFDHTAETLFKDVRQICGGEYIEWSLNDFQNGIRPVRWYRLEPRPFAGGTLDDAANEFRDLLTDSVRLRLRADVPVGSCLSGGLDSSSIVCMANDLLRRVNSHDRQKTFSARAEAERYDEMAYAEEVIKATGVDAHFTLPALDDLFATLPKITWHQDEPFSSTSIFAQWKVFELAAAQQVKVMLDGQGADELLAGYHGFFGVRFATLFKSVRWLQLVREISATRKKHGYSLLHSAKYAVNFLLPEVLRQPLRALVHRESTRNTAWLGTEVLGAEERDPTLALRGNGLQDFSASQLIYTSLPMLLHWEDRDSMAHSVESRVPFLDYRLVEFVLGLPDDFKLSHGVTKRVLRAGMQGILPEKVRLRMDKLGFATPEEVWLRERRPDLFRSALNEAIEQSQGVLLPPAREVLEQMISGKRPFSFLVWRMISFGDWMRRFNVRLAH
jgi:asparagine synthase (glutamine-hydrolysing)